jgi:uncharacterized membrane protein YjjP (DUF1212 family)
MSSPSPDALVTRADDPYRLGTESGRAFLVQLGELLHAHGTPAMRLEEALVRCAAQLGIDGQFLSTPTSLLLGFGEGPAQRTHLARVQPGDVDLGKLVDLDETIEAISAGEIGPDEGLERLKGIGAAPRRYPRWTLPFAFALAASTAARFFGGGLGEIAVSFGVGLLIGMQAIWAGGRRRAALVFEGEAALSASALAVAAAWAWPPLSDRIVTLSGLIVLVPGLTLTVAMNELASRHLVAGTARLAWAATLFLSIGLGVALGRSLQRLLPLTTELGATAPLPGWTLWIALALAPIGFGVLFRARRRDMFWVGVAGWLGFIGARFGSQWLGPELGVLVGALAVGLAGNLYARRFRHPASVMQVPGIMLLVPGSIGFESLDSFLAQDVLTGMEAAFRMALVAAALVGGLLFANALLPPRRSL